MVGVMLAAALVAAPQQVGQYGIVVTRGDDTTSVERVTREAGRLRAEILALGRAQVDVSATLDGRGCVVGADVQVRPWGAGDDATPLQAVAVHIDGDTVRVHARARDQEQNIAAPFPGRDFILAGQSYAAMSMVAECGLAPELGGVVSAAAFPGLRMAEYAVRRSADTVFVSEGGAVSTILLDARGVPVRLEMAGAGSVATRVPYEEALAVTGDAPDYAPPPGSGYLAEDVRFTSAPGVTLAGTLTLPAHRPAPVPAAVLISGSGAQDRDSYAAVGGGWRPFREIAHELTSRGIAVLRFDDRGVGASTGDQGAATEREAAQDVAAAMALLRSRPDVDGDRLFLAGHSEGARIAMMVAARDPGTAGLVLMAGAARPREAMIHQVLWAAARSPGAPRPDSAAVVAALEQRLDSLEASGSREVYRWNADSLAAEIRAPVLVLHGETDRQVPVDQAGKLGAVLRRAGRAVTVRTFPDVNHLLVPDPDGDFLTYDRLESAAVSPAVLAALADWILGRVGG